MCIRDRYYKEEEFVTYGYSFTERVFVCLVRLIDASHNTRGIVPLYVSEEYNVGTIPAPFKPGRFVIMKGEADFRDILVLAEQPAVAYTKEQASDFNLELHYLGIRKKRSLGNVIECLN